MVALFLKKVRKVRAS